MARAAAGEEVEEGLAGDFFFIKKLSCAFVAISCNLHPGQDEI